MFGCGQAFDRGIGGHTSGKLVLSVQPGTRLRVAAGPKLG